MNLSDWIKAAALVTQHTQEATMAEMDQLSSMSSIYHRHIEHFFHIFGGSTVFSLISELARRL